jgi:hypothetical protein
LTIGIVRVTVKQSDGSEAKFWGVGTLVDVGIPSLHGRLVLTARHCVEDARDVLFETKTKSVPARFVCFHTYPAPQAGLCRVAGDVALIVLEEAVQNTDSLPKYMPFENVQPGAELVNHTLREGQILKTDLVVEKTKDAIFNTHATDPNSILLTKGDSGSPLFNGSAIVGVYSSSRSENKESGVTTDHGAYLGAFAIPHAVWLKMHLETGDVQQFDFRKELQQLNEELRQPKS